MHFFYTGRVEIYWRFILENSFAWEKVVELLKNTISETSYATWFNSIKFLEFKDNIFILEVPNIFTRNVISAQYSSRISEAIKAVMGNEASFLLVLEDDKLQLNHYLGDTGKKTNSNSSTTKGLLNSKYTFDEFVVGSNNQLAHAAAVAVAANPGHSYNPFFVYGPVGIGKTHLVQAIAHKLLNDKPGSIINYVTSENFTNELVESIRFNKMVEFRNKYRNSDLLIIDDIQFIAGKDKTQEEFFHTFSTLHSYNRQIIIASDRPPSEINKLEERLRSRFSMGLICDIQAPDYETRMAILNKKAASLNINLDPEVSAYIAENLTSNIREFEGALTRINALSKLTNVPITLKLATEALKDIFTSNKTKELGPDLIKEVVCRYYKVSVAEIESQKRQKQISLPRQVAMYIIRNLTDLAYADIGSHFGSRDHSTVINAYNNIAKEIEQKESFRKLIDKLILEIKGEN